MTSYSAHQLAKIVGVSYRQVDYLCRSVAIATPGSGGRRRFPWLFVRRMLIAKQISDALDPRGGFSWAAQVVIEGPEPPLRSGEAVVVMFAGEIRYHYMEISLVSWPAGCVFVIVDLSPVEPLLPPLAQQV